MKKTAILICFLAIGAFAANAQDETKTTSNTQNETKSSDAVNDQSPSISPNVTTTSEGTSKSLHNGTKLEISDLPKVVSESISADHRGWTPQEVYKIDNQGTTAYEVVVKKNADEMNLVYDATGNLLRTEQRSSIGSGSAAPQSETK